MNAMYMSVWSFVWPTTHGNADQVYRDGEINYLSSYCNSDRIINSFKTFDLSLVAGTLWAFFFLFCTLFCLCLLPMYPAYMKKHI